MFCEYRVLAFLMFPDLNAERRIGVISSGAEGFR